MIYLDNAATTYPKPECVYKALDYANRNAFNAGRGEYKESCEASSVIDEARRKVAGFVGKDGKSVTFTSSATEALNQVIYGLSLASGDVVLVSPFEHNAVIRPLYNLQKRIGIKVIQIPFDRKTWLPNEELLRNIMVTQKPKAVFVSQISNVTGYEIPYDSIFEISDKYGAVTILDASQGFGVCRITGSQYIDYIVFAGHKSLYGSFGVGGFITMRKDSLSVVKAGGTGSDSLNTFMPEMIPYKYEAGSHNVVAIASINASIDWLKTADVYNREKSLTDYLITRLKELGNVHVYVPDSGRVFGIVSISVDNYFPADVGTILYDEYEIAVRTGFHCASFVHDFLETEKNGGTIRISIGAFTSKNDVDELLKAITTL